MSEIFKSSESVKLDRLNYEELAKLLRVKPCTVRAWQMQGLPYIPAGRLKFYDFSAVQAWLLARDAAKRHAKKAQQQAQATT